MIAGPINVDSITWREHTMLISGDVPYLGERHVVSVAYAHVAAAALTTMWDGLFLRFCAGGQVFHMGFADDANGRDAAAELARRMEACR